MLQFIKIKLKSHLQLFNIMIYKLVYIKINSHVFLLIKNHIAACWAT